MWREIYQPIPMMLEFVSIVLDQLSSFQINKPDRQQLLALQFSKYYRLRSTLVKHTYDIGT